MEIVLLIAACFNMFIAVASIPDCTILRAFSSSLTLAFFGLFLLDIAHEFI